ncbi:MAG: hypothetical protein PHW04_05290 [Candidatus Wallbacteria bacterium]|nr:hypothetical protein [Candidatus Wallbacteria bacterium]
MKSIFSLLTLIMFISFAAAADLTPTDTEQFGILCGRLIINGVCAAKGTTIEAYLENGMKCGEAATSIPGHFTMVINGDIPQTEAKEGPTIGDKLIFKANGKTAKKVDGSDEWPGKFKRSDILLVLGDDDRGAPVIVEVKSIGDNKITVSFNEPILFNTVKGNLEVQKSGKPVEILEYTCSPDLDAITLKLSNDRLTGEFKLTVKSISDFSGNLMNREAVYFVTLPGE